MEDRASYNDKKGISPRAKTLKDMVGQPTDEDKLNRWKEIEA
jgi:hypothetical protein